jgi:hypothetical protein
VNGHLAKAQEALEAARTYEPGDVVFSDLLSIARVQAEVAQAAALEKIVDLLTARVDAA